ncbi:MAG: sensor histidine kinase [Escherichia coli]
MQQLVTHLQNTDIQQLTFATYNDQDEFSYLFKAYNDMLSHIHELVKINYEQKILRSEMELKILHMQLNPHFLYNTLDTLYYMALDCNNNDLAQITKSLADMLRYSISESCAPLSCVADEIRHAENYCTIQKIRLGEKLQFYFDIDELLLDQKLPRLSLQPFWKIVSGTVMVDARIKCCLSK